MVRLLLGIALLAVFGGLIVAVAIRRRRRVGYVVRSEGEQLLLGARALVLGRPGAGANPARAFRRSVPFLAIELRSSFSQMRGAQAFGRAVFTREDGTTLCL